MFESWVSNLHKTTCFVINYLKSLARGIPITENLPLASGHPSSLGKKFKINFKRGTAHSEAMPPFLDGAPAICPSSLPRSGFLKAEHTAPVCTSESKEVATGQLFVGEWRWSLGYPYAYMRGPRVLVAMCGWGIEREARSGVSWGSENWKLAPNHLILELILEISPSFRFNLAFQVVMVAYFQGMRVDKHA